MTRFPKLYVHVKGGIPLKGAPSTSSPTYKLVEDVRRKRFGSKAAERRLLRTGY